MRPQAEISRNEIETGINIVEINEKTGFLSPMAKQDVH
jgi:hypothetical protein